MARYTIKQMNEAGKKLPHLIRKGHRGVDAAYIQLRTNHHLKMAGVKYDPLVVDGIIGDHSIKNLKMVQRMYGLTVDGIAGPQTQTHLRMAPAKARAAAAKAKKAVVKPAVSGAVVKPGGARQSAVGVKAVRLGKAYVGRVEVPAGSNVIPSLKAAGKKAGWSSGIYNMKFSYCNYFTSLMLLLAGSRLGKEVSGTWSGPYTGMYCPATKNKLDEYVRKGWAIKVTYGTADDGDLVLFDWQGDGVMDHIGFVTGRSTAMGLPTLEANTSRGTAGSQSNGDGVFLRYRPSSTTKHIYRLLV